MKLKRKENTNKYLNNEELNMILPKILISEKPRVIQIYYIYI